jgi:exonuclease III
MIMKIVSWNCHYGFDGKKPETIKKYGADILVIPECREMDMKGSGYDEKHHDWYGDHKEATDTLGNINKEKDLGIGIFWKDGIRISLKQEWKDDLRHNSDFRYLVPYKVEGNFETFTLIAVWTKNKTDVSDPLDYVQKAHAAVDRYKSIGLLKGHVILIGDFNSNDIWNDRYRKEWNHSALVEKLGEIGIKECFFPLEKNKYHTFYYYRNNEEFWVVDDYCFASVDIAKSAKLSVPDSARVKRWNGLSDHCPIIVDFDL